MILVLKPNASREQTDELLSRSNHGADVHISVVLIQPL